MCGQYNFTNFKARFLHIKAHLLHFLRKDLKYHHKGKNEIKTDLYFGNLMNDQNN